MSVGVTGDGDRTQQAIYSVVERAADPFRSGSFGDPFRREEVSLQDCSCMVGFRSAGKGW